MPRLSFNFFADTSLLLVTELDQYSGIVTVFLLYLVPASSSMLNLMLCVSVGV